jgi:hypothetical protein
LGIDAAGVPRLVPSSTGRVKDTEVTIMVQKQFKGTKTGIDSHVCLEQRVSHFGCRIYRSQAATSPLHLLLGTFQANITLGKTDGNQHTASGLTSCLCVLPIRPTPSTSLFIVKDTIPTTHQDGVCVLQEIGQRVGSFEALCKVPLDAVLLARLPKE